MIIQPNLFVVFLQIVCFENLIADKIGGRLFLEFLDLVPCELSNINSDGVLYFLLVHQNIGILTLLEAPVSHRCSSEALSKHHAFAWKWGFAIVEFQPVELAE